MKNLLSGVALAALLVGTAPAMAQGTDTGQIGPGVSKGSPGSTVTPQSTISGSNNQGIPPNSTLDPTGTSSTTGVRRDRTMGAATGTGKVTDTGQIGPGVSKGSPGSTVSGRNANGIPPNSSMDPTGTSSTMGDHRSGASTPGATASPYDTTGRRGHVSRSTGATTSERMSGTSTMDHRNGMSSTHRRTGTSTAATSRTTRGGGDNMTTEELNRQELSRIGQSSR
jgi:hypothetical protein